jgi:hypothetical protein
MTDEALAHGRSEAHRSLTAWSEADEVLGDG